MPQFDAIYDPVIQPPLKEFFWLPRPVFHIAVLENDNFQWI
jgi:hypothetical protein